MTPLEIFNFYSFSVVTLFKTFIFNSVILLVSFTIFYCFYHIIRK